ncbi:MAG: HAMP domain-containing sensor histidine kinase [Propionivibrio sp.]
MENSALESERTAKDSATAAGRRQQRGLRRALYVVLILSLVLPGIVAGFALIYLSLQRTLESETRVRAEKLADLLQAGMTMPLWEMAPETGRPLVTAIAADPSVTLITVYDINNGVLLDYQRQTQSQVAPIVITRPIARDNEYLGQVVIRYSTSAAIDEAWRASVRLLTIIALQLLVSFILIGAWLSRRVLNPLETLRLSANRIAAGDLQSVVPVLRSDEFGQLSARLDAMRNSLAQSVARLEERVEERTFALKAVNTRLQTTLDDLQRMQNLLVQSEKLASLGSLVAGVAHELNTPIGTGVTVVSTISDKCLELRRQIDQGIRRSQLDAMIDDIETASTLAQKSLQRAARLIHDFKQVAVDQTSSRRREFEMHDMLREMMAAVRLRHKHTPVDIKVIAPPGIVMDSYPGTLEQVLTNLIDNAIIHGAEGRSDCVVTIAAARQGRYATLTVTDNGNGIPAENLDRIFDPFFTTQLGKGGSGLGLSIVYGLVTGLLGGHIAVESIAGQGTTFALELPLVAPERSGGERSRGSAEPLPNHEVN